MDVAAFVVAVISLLISIGVPIYEKHNDKKVNDINLNSEYLKEIYICYLTKEIPKARKIMRFDHDMLCDTNDFCNVLKKFLSEIHFYYYIDKLFYERIKTSIQTLEDLLMESDGKVFVGSDRNNLIDSIDSHLELIYDLMNAKYINGFVEEQ
ncbi:MAG: hypothetical protein IJ643_07950 [Eubacterium sp.]|nr:hypothetical protein [Eubacterium sp.]